MRKIRFLFLFLIINFILFEIFSLIMCRFYNFCSTPNYSLVKEDLPHWVSHDIYGVWHKENSEFNHNAECFSANYYFNNFGAKDKDRQALGSNRTIIVGDSYIEGYGVDNNNNFSTLMENESNTKTKYLNFSSSGYFGSTQYFVLIKDLLQKIEFDRVILFLNPSSDFKDDSFEFGKLFHYKQYRPYLDPKSDQIFYYNEDFKNYTNDHFKIKDILDNYTYSYKFLRYLKQQIISTVNDEKINALSNKNENSYTSFYENFPKDTFEILKTNLFNINKILKERDIKFIVFTLPSKKDLNYFSSNKLAINYLDDEIENYLKKFDIKFSSILNSEKTINKLSIEDYFNCSDHLNVNGHTNLKDIVKNQLILMNELF